MVPFPLANGAAALREGAALAFGSGDDRLEARVGG